MVLPDKFEYHRHLFVGQFIDVTKRSYMLITSGSEGLRPHQLGIAQIMAFNSHMEKYNDVDIAHLWKVAAITK